MAFEIDEFDKAAREGWSVLIQGPAHHLDSEDEQEHARQAGVEPWPGGKKEHFIRIDPARITEDGPVKEAGELRFMASGAACGRTDGCMSGSGIHLS